MGPKDTRILLQAQDLMDHCHKALQSVEIRARELVYNISQYIAARAKKYMTRYKLIQTVDTMHIATHATISFVIFMH